MNPEKNPWENQKVLFEEWVEKTIAENYPDRNRWPDFVARLNRERSPNNLPSFGSLSEIEWLRHQEKAAQPEANRESWLDRYETEAEIWEQLLDLSKKLTHYNAKINEERTKLLKAERLKITIQTTSLLASFYTKTKKGGLERIASLMAKHPIEIVFVGGFDDTDDLNQSDLKPLSFPKWLERRWKDCGLYASCPEYLRKAETTGDPKDLPLTVWPEWLDYRRENNAEERNRRRKNPELNAEVWDDHMYRLIKFGRSRWNGEMYFAGERGGLYRINRTGRREYL